MNPTWSVPSAVQLDRLPEVGVPSTGVTRAMLVEVHAEIMPDATVPSAGAVITGEVSVLLVIVVVLVAVTMLVGVIIPDSVVIVGS